MRGSLWPSARRRAGSRLEPSPYTLTFLPVGRLCSLRVYIRSNQGTLQSHSNPILELGGVQRGDANAPLLSADDAPRQRATLAAVASQSAGQTSRKFRLRCLRAETVVEGVAQQPARRFVISPS